MSLQFNGFTGTLDYVGTGGGGGSITGGGTATQVAFFTAATAIGSDAGLFYLPVSGGGPRLGIGTGTPGFSLHVVGNAQQTIGAETASSAFAPPRLAMFRALGTEAAPVAATSGTTLGQLVFAGYDGVSPGPPVVYSITSGSIQVVAEENISAAGYGGSMRFFTTAIGATSGGVEKMRLADDGSLLLGAPPPAKIAGSRAVITGGALHLLAGNALRLQGAGAGFSSFVDPSHAANILYTLPAAQGPAGTMLTNVDGAGTLDWRQAPAGLPGEDGIDGDPGPPGVTGATGPQGTTGNTGPTGATGAPGLHGMDGIDGDDGMAFPIPGVQGPQGIQGIQGIQGVQGLQGFMGIPGGDGLDGEEGMPMPGIPGPQGVPGALGPQGVQGPPGLSDDGGGGTDEWPSYFGAPSGDSLPQYLLLAGRTGGTNNPTLSIDADGTITGSLGSNHNLTLIACAGATKGLVRVQDELRLYTSAATITTAKFASRFVPSNSISGGGGSFTVLAVQGTLNQTGSTGTLIPLFDFNLTYNVNVGTSAPIFYTFYNRPQITANIAGVGVTDLGFQHQPQFSAVSPGTSFAVISDQGFVCASSYDSGTVGTVSGITRQGFLFNGPAVNGTGVTFTLNQGFIIGDQGTGIPCEAIHSDLTAAAGRFLINDVGGAASEFAGLFTRYNSNVTAGNGMASVLGAASQFARVASVPDTTLLTVPVTGTYRASIYVFTTTVGTGTGTVTGTLKWTDDSGTEKVAVTTNSASLANFTSFAMEVLYFRALATSTVKFSTTLTGTVGTSVYAVLAECERLA